MKKITLAFVALVLIGGIAFSAYYVAKAKSFEKNESYSVENIKSLKVYNDSWDVRFKKSNSNEVTVSAKGKQKGEEDPVTFKKDGEELVIKQEEQKNSSLFGGITFGKKGTIYINVPESGINNIELTNKDGNIEMSNISTNSVIVQNNSGDEKIKGVSANTGEFVSMDGMLSVEDSSFKELNITSTSGDNYMRNVNIDKVEVISVDGEVSIKDIQEGASLSVDTESGDIGVSYKEVPTSLAITVKSNSSDITLNLDGIKKEEDTAKLKKGKIGQGTNNLNLSSNDGVINVTN